MPLPPGYVESHTFFMLGTNPRPAEVVIGWRLTDPGMSQEQADALMEYIDGEMKLVVATDVNFPGGYVLVGNDGGSLRYDVTRDEDGTYSGSAASPQVAALVKKAGSLGGRSNRGRMFIPGIPEAQVEAGGRLNPTYRTQLQSEIEDLIGDLPSAAANVDAMVILHQEGFDLPTVVTNLTTDPVVATQKRRVGR